MINKTDKEIEPFSEEDQKLFEDFAVFCGLALHKAIMLQKIEVQRHRLKIAMELMAYHATVRPDEVAVFRRSEEQHLVPIAKLTRWDFAVNDFTNVVVYNCRTERRSRQSPTKCLPTCSMGLNLTLWMNH